MTRDGRSMLIFVGLGPLVGLAVVIAAVIGPHPTSSLRRDPEAAVALTLAIPFAYFVGVVPAIMAAKLVRLIRRRGLKPEAGFVTLAGALVGMSLGAMAVMLAQGSPEYKRAGLGDPIAVVTFTVLVLACVLPTLVCWAVGLVLDGRAPDLRNLVSARTHPS